MPPTRPALYYLIGTINISPDIKTPVPDSPGAVGSQQRFMWNATHNPLELTEVADFYECHTIDYPASNLEGGYSASVGKANLIAAINARPGPFVLAGMSQGAGVISDVYDELRTGSLQDRRSDLIRGLAAGNPRRQAGTSIPGGIVQPGHGMAANCLEDVEPLWWELAATNDIVCTNDDSPMGQLVTASYEWSIQNYTGAEAGFWSAVQAAFSGEPFNTLMTAVNYWMRAFGYLSADNPHFSYMEYKPVIGDNRPGIDIAAADLIELAKSLGVGPSAAATGWFAENFVTLNAKASDFAVGVPALSSGQALRLNGKTSDFTTGAPKLIQQQFITLSGKASDFVAGQPMATWLQEILISGVPSAFASGSPTVTENKTISLVGFDASGGAGDLKLVQTITLAGVASSQAFGAPNIVPGSVGVTLTGVASGFASGTPAVAPGAVGVTLTGKGSDQAISSLGTIEATFDPVSYENINWANVELPAGNWTEWRWEAVGASGGSGNGSAGAFSARAGGSGSGGGAGIDTGWQPRSAFGGTTTLSMTRGLKGASAGAAGSATTLSCGPVSLSAGAGAPGNTGSSTSAAAAAGGTASVSGITGATTGNGGTGGGSTSASTASAGGDSSGLGAPGGGGGAGRNGGGGSYASGRGGNSSNTATGGAARGAGNASAGVAGDTGPGGAQTGGGGGGGGNNGTDGAQGGLGGAPGAGSGGGAGGNNAGAGRPGNDGYMKLSIR